MTKDMNLKYHKKGLRERHGWKKGKKEMFYYILISEIKQN